MMKPTPNAMKAIKIAENLQKQIEKTQAAADQIQALISQEERVIDTAEAITRENNSHKNLLEDLLADAATGASNKQEIDRVESQIAEANKKLKDIAPAVEEACLKIPGLQRKRADLGHRITNLAAQKRAELSEAVEPFLMEVAEKLGEEYFQAAQTLKSRYYQIRALSVLIPRIKGEVHGNIFTKPQFDLISIPLFNLSAFKEYDRWQNFLPLDHSSGTAGIPQSYIEEAKEMVEGVFGITL